MFAKIDWNQLARRGKKPPIRTKRLSSSASEGESLVGQPRSERLFDSAGVVPAGLFDVEGAIRSAEMGGHDRAFSGFAWSQDEDKDTSLGWRTTRRSVR